MFDRQISQREYDAQERWVKELARQVCAYRLDMKNLRELLRKYPKQARKILRKLP